MADIQKRALDAVARIAKETGTGRAAAVSHSDVIKPVLAHYLGMDLDSIHRLSVANARRRSSISARRLPASATSISRRGSGATRREATGENIQRSYRSRIGPHPYAYMEYKLHNWSGEFSAKAEERYGYRKSVDGKELGYNPCTHLWFMMNIHYDGAVSICCRDTMQGAVVGDVKKNSLLEIWNGPAMVGMRKLMIEKKPDRIPICSGTATGSGREAIPAAVSLRMAKIFIRSKIRSLGR